MKLLFEGGLAAAVLSGEAIDGVKNGEEKRGLRQNLAVEVHSADGKERRVQDSSQGPVGESFPLLTGGDDHRNHLRDEGGDSDGPARGIELAPHAHRNNHHGDNAKDGPDGGQDAIRP